MRTTTGTKNKIKKFEGLRLKAYVCACLLYTSHAKNTTVMQSGESRLLARINNGLFLCPTNACLI